MNKGSVGTFGLGLYCGFLVDIINGHHYGRYYRLVAHRARSSPLTLKDVCLYKEVCVCCVVFKELAAHIFKNYLKIWLILPKKVKDLISLEL